MLTFTLDGESCGLPVEHVREVVRAALPGRLPKAPPIVEGVLNVRGELVPLVDLRGRFGFARRPLAPDDHVVIARVLDRAIAFGVDQVQGVIEAPTEDASSAGEIAAGIEHVAGVLRLPDGLLVIYDLRAFLSADELLGLGRALAEASPT